MKKKSAGKRQITGMLSSMAASKQAVMPKKRNRIGCALATARSHRGYASLASRRRLRAHAAAAISYHRSSPAAALLCARCLGARHNDIATVAHGISIFIRTCCHALPRRALRKQTHTAACNRIDNARALGKRITAQTTPLIALVVYCLCTHHQASSPRRARENNAYRRHHHFNCGAYALITPQRLEYCGTRSRARRHASFCYLTRHNHRTDDIAHLNACATTRPGASSYVFMRVNIARDKRV